MELKKVKIKNPDNLNLIFGQSHFVKTVEDLHEIMVNSVPNIEFGLAFAEASGKRLIMKTGTDEKLQKLAVQNVNKIGAGHSFVIFLKDAFPINVLNSIKSCREVCRVFCATANPVEVIVCETEQGRAVLGVVDGGSPQDVEKKEDEAERKDFLREIGYKL